MKGEFYKMEFDAWDEGTVDLTLEEEAAYLRVCHQMYRRANDIPDSEKLLCSLWRCHPNKARKLRQALIDKGKLLVTPEGHLANTKVRQVVDNRETLSTTRAVYGRTGGIRSGEVRRKSLNGHGDEEAIGTKQTNQNEAEERRGEEIRGEEKVVGADAPVLPMFEDDKNEKPPPEGSPESELRKVVDAVRAKAIIEHRKKIKKPMTAHAAKLMAMELAKCANPNEGADMMIASAWQGFRLDWYEERKARSPPPGSRLERDRRL